MVVTKWISTSECTLDRFVLCERVNGGDRFFGIKWVLFCCTVRGKITSQRLL